MQMSDLDHAKFCFIPDEKDVFIIAEITQRDAAKKEVVVSVLKTKKIVTLKYDVVVPIGSMEELDNPPTDLTKLVYVNRPGILHTLRARFMQDRIYTSIGPILVALNPFKWISGIYEETIMLQYKNNQTNLTNNPHVFAVSQDAYCDLSTGQNQSLIISGESGAGKTEATKQCLSYLAFLAGSATGIQTKILKASPILEAWGNAKTLRNNNSSRFGKFIEIWFDGSRTITGSSNTTYILEKSRVVFQEKDERNYHVFYQLLKGGTAELLQELELSDLSMHPETAMFINQSGCIDIENVDDAADFREVNEAFIEIGFTSEEQKSLYTIIAGILHFGNIAYEANPSNSDESLIQAQAQSWLEKGVRCFGVDLDFAKKALLYKQIRSGGANSRRTSVAYASYKLDAAYESRNALCKEIYRRCFDYIVGRINALMGNDRDQAVNMIGILDIFGFEIFKKNSFEQLCINLANEALQQHFNYNIFQAEMDVYVMEDVPVPPLEYRDNQDVLDLIVKRPLGLIPMLDEEGLVPKGSWEGFLSKFSKQHAKNPRAKKTKLVHELGIVHYAGDVFYDATLFLIKNKDTLSADLVDVFSASTLPLLRQLFTENPEQMSVTPESSSKRTSTQSAAKMTVGKSFSLQLEKLIADLNATNPRYIRCIKPNQVKKPNIFMPDLTNEQLTYSGVFEAVIIMQNGYPFRLSHWEFRSQYHMLVQHPQKHALLFDSIKLDEFTTAGSLPAATLSSEGSDSFTRDQCKFMVSCLCEAYPERDLEGCFPGKTRTFYRSVQHNALVKLRTVIVDRAVLRLQTCGRAYCARRLTRAIRRAENEWFASLSTRKTELIAVAAEKVDGLVMRLNSCVSGLGFKLDCSQIGRLYGKAFESEDQLLPAIQAALQEQVDIMKKYDRLEEMLRGLDTVNFTVKYRAALLSFKWEDKTELKECAEKIAAMGELVKVKRKFLSGISGKNEVALEEAVKELQSLRNAGKIEEDFCVDEAVQAQKIITEAEMLFTQLLSSVAAAITAGRFTLIGTGKLAEREVSVDVGALNAIISAHDRDMNTKPVDALPPMRVRSLQLLCKQLRDIRVLARDRMWDELWSELQARWSTPIDTTDSREGSGFQSSENFLPPDLKAGILQERREMSLAAITFCVVPQVQSAIDRNQVPSIPTLGAADDTSTLVDTTELSAQIAAAEKYSESFDQELLEFLDLAKEHLFYRQEVASRDWERITALMQRGSIVPLAHPDRANIKNFVKMFDTVSRIKERVLQDKVTGAPGSFEFASIQVEGLAMAYKEAAAMAVRGKAWQDLLEVAKTLCRVRSLLQEMEFTEAWEFMQSLSSSEPWQAIVPTAMDATADSTVLDALGSAVEELKSYGDEILHARAMKDIALALSTGGIGDENSNFSTTNISTAALQGELDSKSLQLIVTDAANKLLENCKVVQRLRSLALTAQWSEVERVILALWDPKLSFQDCHVNCQEELQRYYNKVHDLKVCAALESAMAAGKISLLPEGDHNRRCDLASVETAALKDAIDYSKQGRVLSAATWELLSVACGLYCLRSVLVADYWEPRRRFFFADTATENLAGQVSTLDSDPALAKARNSLATTITTLNKLESEVKLEFTAKQPLVARAEVSALSVVEVLVHLRKSLPTGSAIEEEIAAVEVLNRERRCLLMLLLSAFTGRIKGSLDDFDFSDVVTNFIEAAIAHVQEALERLGAAPVVRNWMLAAQYLLSVRQTILRATAGHPESEPILSEVFQVQDLQDILTTVTTGYPVQELNLVLNKLKDQTSFQELLRALAFGQPVFEEGKLDISRVQHAHLVERLETAKKNPVRSDRLDRLFFYVELTIRLRTAIGLGQWELSDREKSNADGANAMITVKRCLRELEQARRFFSTPVPGVPPPVVIDEFRLIGREWERRLVKQRFGAAFKSGAITGQPLSLNLIGLRTELLETEIARMKEAHAAATEKDASFELYIQAGTELVSIRKEASRIQASYKHPTKFSYPSDSLHTILDAPDFIPDAISCALAGVDGAIAQPYRFAEEWKGVDALLSVLQGCPEIPATQEEVRLVAGESRDRAYIVSVLGAFNSAAGVLRSPRSAQELIDRLISSQGAYDESLKQGKVVAASTHWRSNRTVRQNRVLEMLHSSAVVLVHFLRAHSSNSFDPYDRDWTEDKNNTRTPRLFTLSTNLTASHSMQQVLRCARQVSLHPRVQSLVTAATMRLEDAISKQEMLQSLTDAQYVYTGTVGNVKTNTAAVPFLQYVMERVERVGVEDHSVGKIRAYCAVHQDLRRTVLQKDYVAGFAVLDDFLGNGKRSLQFVLQVMANKNYQVTAEANTEFLLLAQDICDRAWLDLAKQCVVADRVRGKRGALHVTEIGWKEVDRALTVYDSLPAASPLAAHMHKVCELVKTLRLRLLGNGEYLVEAQQIDSSDSRVAFQKLEFAKKRSEFGAVAPKVLSKLADQVTSSACQRVASISATNVTWQRLEDLSTFSQFVQPIVDALNDRVDLDGALDGPFKTDLLQECELVNRHCESLQAGVTLEAALETELAFIYSSDGLSVKKDSSGRLVRTLAGATAQRWQLLGHPEEYWWASLTALSKSFLGFIDQGAALVTGAADVFILRPGTEHFKTMLFTMYALIAQVNNIVQQLKTLGYRKRASLPSSLLLARDRMRAAIVEHNCLIRLERIVSAECIVTHTAEDTQLLQVEVVHVHTIMLVEKDEELPRSVEYEQYGRDIKAMIAATRVDTTLGKLLVDMLQQLVELRMAVAGKHWQQAKLLCAAFHWIPDFASSRDIDECQRFLRYKEYHRAIESAILSCSLPSIVGWSLHALSRDIALNINDRSLCELLANGQTKYGNLSVQYLALSQLLTAGEKLLEIVGLVRKGLWVGSQKYSDEISGGHAWEGSRYISAECRAAPAKLRALVHSSPSLETHMREFLLQTASNLDTELTVVQLEHSIQKTLRAVQLTGKPGELIIPEGLSPALQAMGEQIASVGTLVKQCHSFRAADQAARIYQKLIEAHLRGSLEELVKYYDLLRYLSEIDCRPGELSVATALTPTAIEEEELLNAKDSDFAAEIASKASPSLLQDAGEGPLHVREEGRINGTGKYWDDAHMNDKSELQKAFVLCTGYAFSDAVALRAEVNELLGLLHRHVAIENMYVDYIQVVAVAEEIGEPGALEIGLIKTDALSAFIVKYSPFCVQSPRIPSHLGHTLQEMVKGLLTIRQGQITNNTSAIAAGLEQAGAACAKENEYELLPSAVVFGGAARNCFEHIAEEVELADEDMQQRRLMDQLRLALAFPGLPTTGFPYYISGIRVEALDEAYDACNVTIPACAEARRLYQAASILLVLRKYALRRDWTAMIAFLDSLEVDDLDKVFLESENMAEFTAAREVMLVSKAIEIAIESYIAGYIGGSVGAIAPCGDIFFNAMEPKASLEVFEKLDSNWINAPVRRHYNTVETLFAIRSNASMRRWEDVLQAASTAADGADTGTRPMVELCLPEVLLARDHAAYVLSLKHAKAALSTGALRGVVGDAHTWQVEIDTLQEAYRAITTINCRRDDILRYKAALELIFRLRRAILLDQWFCPDITHDYLHLLGSNFQLQPERVQHKALYARLVDQSVVNKESQGDPTVTVEDAAAAAPEETDREVPLIETVESIMASWAEVKASGVVAEDALEEVELAHKEVRHRSMVALLLKNIHTAGIQGAPGQVDTSQAVTRLLEKAIVTASEHSDVALRGDCKGLLRDAKLLLMARRFRINEQWLELHHMLEEIELTLSAEAATEEATVSDDATVVSEEMVVKEYVRSIVKPVWQELQLLKYDCLFQLSLTNFRAEMTRPGPPPPPSSGPGIRPPPTVVVSQDRIDVLLSILEYTETAAVEYPSPDFARLVEAEAAAVELRKFCQQNPNKSPQEIIHLVAQTKRKDEEAGLTSYMALLIHEISHMANVLDFPVNLKTIHREILKGQKYLGYPIGQLETSLIDIEVMTAAYNAALSSLELFGTEHDHSFMALAEVVIRMRGALLRSGLHAAIAVIDSNDELLQNPLMRDEVERLRIEKENVDAGRLMEIGLKSGRYIDVLSIARMVYNYEYRIAAKVAAVTPVDSSPLANFGPETKRASRRAQRVSREVASSSSRILAPESPCLSETDARSRRAHGSTVYGGKRRSIQVEEGTASEEFIEGVLKSINALNRAIAIALQVRVRSANTDFYLNAVQVILRLRENLVADNWDEVRAYLDSEENWQDLPDTALEEVRACKEGLVYRESIVRLSRAFYVGAIYGAPHEIDYDDISCSDVTASLEACKLLGFTDRSAVLMLEFAQRLVTVRHLLLADEWVETEQSGQVSVNFVDQPSKLRKSIYAHHAVPPKRTAQKLSVDSCVKEFVDFQATAIPKLQALFKVASQIDNEERVDMDTVVQEAQLVLLHKPNHGPDSNTPDEWLTQIWHAVLHVVLEINLAQQVTQYRDVLLRLIDAADSTPEIVRAYVTNRHHLHSNIHPLLRHSSGSHHHDDHSLYGSTGADVPTSFAASYGSGLDVSDLEAALQCAQGYLSFVGFETSEDMLRLQETCKLLVDFRTALREQKSHDLVLQLMMRAKTQASKGFLSSENGIFELNAYISSTAESARIQNGLCAAIQSKHASGPLNALRIKEIGTAELQKWIDDAFRFLARGGGAMSVGVSAQLLQARVIHKLRSALLDGEWSVLEHTLRKYEAQAAEWESAGLEFQHIKSAFAFRSVTRRLRHYIADFRSEEDLGHTLMCLHLDLKELQDIFAEINSLLQYSSPLLQSDQEQHYTSPEACPETPREVISSEFYRLPAVVSGYALWRLFQALQNSNWFVKQTIHDCEGQVVAATVDPFLYAFFGVGESNYASNVRHNLTAADVRSDCSVDSAASSALTVFSVLVSTHWATFPLNIRSFFNRVRNRLVDRYVRADLRYYCRKGATNMDTAGNLMLSSISLQFLKITLADAQKATELARSLCVKFSWTPETAKWLDNAQTALSYRQTLISGGQADTIVALLRKDGLMRGHSVFDPKLFSIHTELEVVEKYAQAHVAERTAHDALQFLAAHSEDKDFDFSDSVLENVAVLELFELASAPIPVAEPSAYLLDMLHIVCLTRDAIFAAMLGGQARFLPIVQCLRESVAFHAKSSLGSVNMAAVVATLTAACKKAYHAELLDLAYTARIPHIERKFARVLSSVGVRRDGNYLRDSARSAPASPSKHRPKISSSLELVELTGMAKLTAFTERILTALCELLYFHQDEEFYSVGARDQHIEKLRRMVPTSPRSQAPYQCFLNLCALVQSMDDVYGVYEPRWAAALLIAVFYLSKEAGRPEQTEDGVTGAAATGMVNLSQDLVQFCRDIQLDRAVFAAHVLSAPPRAGVKGQRRGQHRSSVEIDTAPSLLMLVKHLTSIRTNCATPPWALSELKSGFDIISSSAMEATQHLSALSLENTVSGEEREARAALLRELPIGAVTRAVAQSKVLLKAFV